MSERRTLTVKPVDQRDDAPRLQRKGRGWNIAESRLDSIHEAAREAKRNPTEAQTLLAQKLADAGLGKYRFRRQVVIGSAIVDFACQSLRLAVFVEDQASELDPALSRRRDKSLETVGIEVLRVSAADILADADAVVSVIMATMKRRWEDLRAHGRGRQGQRGQSSARGGYR